MKAVIDTNVLVSGLFKQGAPPAEVVADVLAGVLVPLYDQRIIDEYREVLVRPKLKIPTAGVGGHAENGSGNRKRSGRSLNHFRNRPPTSQN